MTVLLAAVFGSRTSTILTRRTNPVMTMKVSLFSVSIVLLMGMVLLAKENARLIYLYYFLYGVPAGAFYAGQTATFSSVIPKGQESEFSGFFVNAILILSWLPPLLFTIMAQNKISIKWGIATLVIFSSVSVFLLQMMEPWDRIRESAQDPVSKSSEECVECSDIEKTENKSNENAKSGDIELN
eukprot:CAMPEP_0172518736 /NCGR_PEP_ID=MMETSP1066-20121228/290992_1 /TAXON_ID=671091 /ORGANISM="Coscinodiscus wailesii, Strain CCMP2513" /LENGTH=183 /DNA_ID=CAMNT_0013301179 /DNA_START=1216 /DNA_END=1764 /DNA_ORIENTATION=-